MELRLDPPGRFLAALGCFDEASFLAAVKDKATVAVVDGRTFLTWTAPVHGAFVCVPRPVGFRAAAASAVRLLAPLLPCYPAT